MEEESSARLKKVATEASGNWKGIDKEVRSQLIDLERKCEDNSWKTRREARRKRAALTYHQLKQWHISIAHPPGGSMLEWCPTQGPL